MVMANYEKPLRICSIVDLCGAPNTRLLGGNKCTFGPHYWCHTQAHAEACNVSARIICTSSHILIIYVFYRQPTFAKPRFGSLSNDGIIIFLTTKLTLQTLNFYGSLPF